MKHNKEYYQKKKEKGLVSIIVPVYNVEKYVTAALETIINQTYKNIEIICVNDGSTDDSLNILKKFEQRDERIIIFTQENKGLSGARNSGLKLAKGEYTYFFDSDDLLETDAIETCVKFMEEKSLDLINFQAYTFSEGVAKEKFYPYETKIPETTVLDISDFLREVPIPASPVWLFFYRSSFLEKNDLTFYEGILREDSIFTVQVLAKIDKIGFLKRHFFHRRIRPNSIMTDLSSKNRKKMIDSLQIVLHELNELKEDNTLSISTKKYIERKIVDVYLQLSKYYKSPFSMKKFKVGFQYGISLKEQMIVQLKVFKHHLKKHKRKGKLERMF